MALVMTLGKGLDKELAGLIESGLFGFDPQDALGAAPQDILGSSRRV
jgi:hypothetical protein